MVEHPKPNVVVSRCLGFDNCRYNGQTIPDPFVDKLEPFVNYTTVCPEVQIGLGVPRDPVRIVAQDDEKRLMQPATGADVTEAMRAYTADFLAQVGDDVDGFILKNRSPSCGMGDVKVYASTKKGAARGKTAGFFGGPVQERFSHLAIEDEGRLKNQRLRQHFMTKLFALARLRQVRQAGTMGALVQFHSANKYLLMGYSQKTLREMGPLVANHDKRPFSEVFADYERLFAQALAKPARCPANINVLVHTIGHLKRDLEPREKTFFLDSLDRYRQGKIPFSVPLNMMIAYAIRFEEPYLLQQTFFAPYPDALVEVSNTGKVPECFLSENQ